MTKTFLVSVSYEDGREFKVGEIEAPDWEIAQRVLETGLELGHYPINAVIVGELVYRAEYLGIIHPN